MITQKKEEEKVEEEEEEERGGEKGEESKSQKYVGKHLSYVFCSHMVELVF